MIRPILKLWVGLVAVALILLINPVAVLATAPPALSVPGGLSLSQIKVTGSEFVLLQNNTGTTITDLSTYWLYNFNNTNPLTSGVSSSTQQLPSGSLGPGQIVQLAGNGGPTCGAAITGKLSISLTDAGGFLEIVQQSLVGGILISTAGDAVSWSSGTNSASGMISNVPSSTSAPNAVYYRYQNISGPPAYLWQRADVDSANICQLLVAAAVADTTSSSQLVLSTVSPPAIFETANSNSSTGSLPASDIGLTAPQITELLPNPASPASDSEDEFIELYNSNSSAFDLSGFRLQVGLSTKHDYTFPSGTLLAPKSFKAFYSADTGLSMSNSSGQAALFDPAGNLLGQTDAYASAKESQTWALANGKWYWTTNPTPNAANTVNPATTSKSKTNNIGGSVGGASTTTANSGAFNQSAAAPAPVHAWTLAGVGSAALLYAGYEYRNDLANHIYRLRRYAEARRASRK